MMDGEILPPAILQRKAVVHVRQSTQSQVEVNTEGRRRQYELVDVTRRRGFRTVEVIDDDLGRSAGGMAVMARMATRFCDTDIAATLNRMGVHTGQGMTWTAHRVGSIRKVHGMHAYRSAAKDGAWLTMREAAGRLGVTSHVIRRMIVGGVLPAEQVVQGAPWQIQAKDLDAEAVLAGLACKGGPRHPSAQAQLPMFPDS